MKKIVTILLMLFISLMLFAETRTASIQLQGAYQSALNMSIDPIAAQTESYLAGMPFNIEEEFVKYSLNSDGRAIANWNVLSNTKYKIYIKVEDMFHVDDQNHANPLSYHLTFTYNLSYPEHLSQYDNAGSFLITSGKSTTHNATSPTKISIVNKSQNPQLTDNYYEVDFFDGMGDVKGGLTGTVDGRVFFKFTQDSTKAIEDDKGKPDTAVDENEVAATYKSGNYTATVTFYLEEAE